MKSFQRRFLLLSAVILFFPLSNAFTWETAIAGVITTSPAQGMDGKVYSTADDRALHCLDSVTGREYWSFRPGRKLKGFTVISPDGSVLILTSQNDIVSVSPGGRELWRRALIEEPLLPPAADPYGTIYILTGSNNILCLDRNGSQIWEKAWSGTVDQIFATHRALLISAEGETSVILSDGTVDSVINDEIRHMVYSDPELYWQNSGGSWKILDVKDHSLKPADSPLQEGTIYADENILITYEHRVVAGRQDWFMEAMEAGEDAYNPYYQKGSNPGRSSAVMSVPGEAERLKKFAENSSTNMLPLIAANPEYLDKILLEFESVHSFQELIQKDPDYDLVLQDIVSDSHVVSFDVHRKSIDSYSRFRIYRILSKWGNLKSRETLLFLSSVETDPDNLALLLDGLGRIGLDRDGRSMLALKKARIRYPYNRNLTLSAVRNASLLAQYNGNKSILSMMNFFVELQQLALDKAVMAQIRKELNSF